MGIRSVAVYSEADRRALHVLEADEAYLIGPPPSSDSYLRASKILDVARKARADAIHPGYGFLAERAPFSRAVRDAGLVFIGPSPETIGAMGDKTEARRRMKAAGVPIVPGVTEAISDPSAATAVAEDVGYPVLLKASAGGGGKGMRVVEDPSQLEKSFEAASREAQAAFGDGSVYLERYLDAPRHIEIQVMGDRSGRVIHFGERECSIQRRHQKLIEEAPSPVVSEALREEMGTAAVRAAEAVDYLGAGTVEFLFKGGEFFFLEMNTRLQVEHPVTELVYGVDLVELQMRVAAGEKLSLQQEDLVPTGHSIECRITSEDARRGFLPSIGRIDFLKAPGGPGVRWDGGIIAGFEVGLHYDPLLGKLIVHAPSRAAAIRRMARCLEELVIRGVETCIPFHRRVMDEEDFQSGNLSIRYLEDHPDLVAESEEPVVVKAAAVAAELLQEKERNRVKIQTIRAGGDGGFSAWKRAGRPFSGGR
ncbi:MAG: acetyl-CoA carboxylase biotin carboxylase subunit [Gemmatimonadetes bacterium]|nr:acetyl-CoA carboxylase biotin carboxylase subunit [Gemmatimonadota bacterium]